MINITLTEFIVALAVVTWWSYGLHVIKEYVRQRLEERS